MFGAALSCTVLCTPVLNFGLIIHWFIADVNLWFVVTRCDPLHLWSTWFHKWALLELNYFDNHRPDWWWCSAHLCCLKTVFIKWHPDQSHGAVHGLVMPAAWVNPARGINTSCEWGGLSCRNNTFLIQLKLRHTVHHHERTKWKLIDTCSSEWNHLVFFLHISVTVTSDDMMNALTSCFPCQCCVLFWLPLLGTVADSQFQAYFPSLPAIYPFTCFLVASLWLIMKNIQKKTLVYLKSIVRFHQSASLAVLPVSGVITQYFKQTLFHHVWHW